MSQPPEFQPASLEQLILAGASAAGRPALSESAWRQRVEHVAETLDVGPGTGIFDVGCAAGAFLYPLWENGYVVGGLDPDAALVADARSAMPDGRFEVAPLTGLDPADPWDVVVASDGLAGCGGADQVRGVLARITSKASHGVALLGVREYADGTGPGLGQAWLLRVLAEMGVAAIQFEDDGDGRYRVFARV